MGAPARDLATHLDSFVAYALGVNVFIGKLPADPDDCIAVMDTGAVLLNPKYKRDEVLVQFIIRGAKRVQDGTGYDAAYAVARDIQDIFLGVENLIIDSVEYFAFNAVGGINPLGYDKNERPLFSFNIRVTKDNENGGNRIPL